MASRDAYAHAALVASLQADNMADDLEPPTESIGWPEERLQAWFENGGVEEEVIGSSSALMIEKDVSIPRSDGGAPLHGLLLWPPGAMRVAAGLVWAPANPGKRFGADHMGSKVPSAVSDACKKAGLPLLRFDYAGVRGSGDPAAYDADKDPFHPTGMECIDDAFLFMKSQNCSKVALGGHSMGANAMMPVAARRMPAAIVSSATAPLIWRFVPPELAPELKAAKERNIKALPAGVPKLFIVGENDRMSPAKEMEEMVSLTPDPKTSERIAGAGHSHEMYEEEAAKRMVQFVVDALA